jgi:hypothetical protein
MQSIVRKIHSLQSITHEDKRFLQTQQWMLSKDTRDLCPRSVVAVLAMSINPGMLDLNNPSDFLMRQEADIFMNRFVQNPYLNTSPIEAAFQRWKLQDVDETKKYVQDRMVYCYLHNLENSYFRRTLQNMGEAADFLNVPAYTAIQFDAAADVHDLVMAHVAPMPLVQRYVDWRKGKLDILDFLQKLHRSHLDTVPALLQLT